MIFQYSFVGTFCRTIVQRTLALSASTYNSETSMNSFVLLVSLLLLSSCSASKSSIAVSAWSFPTGWRLGGVLELALLFGTTLLIWFDLLFLFGLGLGGLTILLGSNDDTSLKIGTDKLKGGVVGGCKLSWIPLLSKGGRGGKGLNWDEGAELDCERG